MKFITVRDFRTSPASIWKQLPNEREMVVTNNGRPIALLTPLSDTDLEDTIKAVRKARAAQAFASMQARSLELGNDRLSENDIEKEIRAAREGR